MSVIKRWNEATSQWEVAVVGKTGPVGPTGPTGPSGPPGDVATSTLWDVKGDIAVALGPDSATRLAAGTDTDSLVADSSTSAGLSYRGRSASGGLVHLLPGQYYPKNLAGAAFAPGGIGEAFGTALPCVAGSLVTDFSINVTTAQASAIIRFGIYASNAFGRPISNLLLTGTFDAGTTGRKTVSSTITCPSPWLWMFVCPTTSPTWQISGFNNNSTPAWSLFEDANGNTTSGSVLIGNYSAAFTSSIVISDTPPAWWYQPAWRYRFV